MFTQTISGQFRQITDLSIMASLVLLFIFKLICQSVYHESLDYFTSYKFGQHCSDNR